MAGFMKRELLRHLTRFAKNLDPAKLNISAMRGEGELNGLELDEEVIMDLLELPTWLAIRSVRCNRLTIKIQWTALKTKPICIFLDCVSVVMETCENLRAPNSTAGNKHASGNSGGADAGKYGLAERVIDGVSVHINSVMISFKSYAFSADIDLSQLVAESTSPNWGRVDELRKTRVKDETRQQVIIFKKVQLGVIRIALNALDAHDAPILLISNNSEVQIGIKKKLSDCGFIASKLKFVIDDLLWVLNDSQIKAVISYFNMLKPLIMRAHKQSQMKSTLNSGDSRESAISKGASAASAGYAQNNSFRLPKNDVEIRLSKMFDLNDILETSYHLVCRRIDLHLVEDNSKRAVGSVPLRLEGGAIQLSLRQLCLDHYPYHFVANSVEEMLPLSQTFYHWENYTDVFEERNVWANQLMTKFKDQYSKLQEQGKLSGSTGLRFCGTNCISVETQPMQPFIAKSTPRYMNAQSYPIGSSNSQRLMSSCFVLFLDSYALHHVTSNKTSSSEVMSGKLIYSDKSTFHIPSEVPSVLAIYTDYYFTTSAGRGPSSGAAVASASSAPKNTSKSAQTRQPNLQNNQFVSQLPLPHANFYVKFNPFCVDFSASTLIWLNSFARRVSKDVQLPENTTSEIVPHVDMKVEFLMPQVKLTVEKHPEDQPDRPRGIEVAMSTVEITNLQDYKKHNRDSLIQQLSKSYLASGKPAFATHEAELKRFCPACFDKGRITISSFGQNMLRTCGFYDVLTIEVDQVWADWFGIKTTKLGRLPFIEPVSFRLYVTYPQLHNIVSSQLRAKRFMSVDGFGATSGNTSQKLTPDLLTSAGAKVNPNNQQVTDMRYSSDNPTMHVIFIPLKRVTVYLDHYQFLVLMRIQEMMTQTLDFIDQDTKLIMGNIISGAPKNPSGPSMNMPNEFKVSVIGLLPSVDVALILPAQPEPPEIIARTRSNLLCSYEKEESLSSKIEIEPEEANITNGRVSSTQDSYEDNDIEDATNNNVAFVEKVVSEIFIPAVSAEVISSDFVNIDDDEVGTMDCVPSVRIAVESVDVETFSDPNEKLMKSTISSNRTMRSSSGVSSASTSSKVNLTLKSAASLSAKFSAGLTNTTSAMGKSFTDAISIAGSEISTGSGGYSSEDDFICLNADRPTSGIVPKASSYEDELKPINNYNPEEEFLGEERKDANASVLVARLSNVQCCVQMLGDNACTVLNLAIPGINLEEHPKTTLSKFIVTNAKFEREWGGKNEPQHEVSGAPIVEVRLDSPGIVASQLYGDVAARLGELSVMVEKLEAELSMSFVASLIDMIEDELIQQTAPLKVKLTNAFIRLNEDRPPANALTSPGAIPLKLSLTNLSLYRNENLVLHINDSSNDRKYSEETSMNNVSMTTTTIDESSQLNAQNRALVDRTEELEAQLLTVRAQLAEALNENSQLQHTLRKMQATVSNPTAFVPSQFER